MIAQAAIRKNGVTWTLPRPARHAHVMSMLGTYETAHGAKWVLHDGEQGFVDDDGSFLGRSEAARHAVACRQVSYLRVADFLFSEDVW